MVNYRGSTGFGQSFLTSLPGQCGTHDVADCVAAAVRLLATDRVDAQRVSVFGGSHGGFLTGHLIGQFPQLFRAAVMRNPVLNIAWEVGSTDIPDWCYVETGLPYSPPHQQHIPTADEYAYVAILCVCVCVCLCVCVCVCVSDECMYSHFDLRIIPLPS